MHDRSKAMVSSLRMLVGREKEMAGCWVFETVDRL